MATCFLAMLSADRITCFYNDKNRNGTTMQNMPFEDEISETDRKQITIANSYCQVGATLFMLHDMNTAFSCLFAIQLGAFLMTLVRKSILTSNQWHLFYGISLWINIFLYRLESMNIDSMLCYSLMYGVYTRVFFTLRLQKYIAWSILFGFLYTYRVFTPTGIEIYLKSVKLEGVESYIRLLIITYFLGSNMYTFLPLLSKPPVETRDCITKMI